MPELLLLVLRTFVAAVGGQKSIQVSRPALSEPNTTQSERDTTRHNPTLRSRRTSPELDGLLPPYRLNFTPQMYSVPFDDALLVFQVMADHPVILLSHITWLAGHRPRR
jgi:hypothetical protein